MKRPMQVQTAANAIGQRILMKEVCGNSVQINTEAMDNGAYFIRIHANANDDSSVNGAETLCQTKDNPYNADLYPQSRKLSQAVLDALCEECGKEYYPDKSNRYLCPHCGGKRAKIIEGKDIVIKSIAVVD